MCNWCWTCVLLQFHRNSYGFGLQILLFHWQAKKCWSQSDFLFATFFIFFFKVVKPQSKLSKGKTKLQQEITSLGIPTALASCWNTVLLLPYLNFRLVTWVKGVQVIEMFVICMEDRLPGTHLCLNLCPLVIKFSQPVSVSIYLSLPLAAVDYYNSVKCFPFALGTLCTSLAHCTACHKTKIVTMVQWFLSPPPPHKKNLGGGYCNHFVCPSVVLSNRVCLVSPEPLNLFSSFFLTKLGMRRCVVRKSWFITSMSISQQGLM